MSWQDYVDNQLLASQCVSKACIAGHDGGVWAKSEGFDVSASEKIFLKKNLQLFRKKTEIFSLYESRKKSFLFQIVRIFSLVERPYCSDLSLLFDDSSFPAKPAVESHIAQIAE
jgi:Profilin